MKRVGIIGFLVLSGACKHAAEVPGVLLASGLSSIPHIVDSSPSLSTPNVPTLNQAYVEFDRDMDVEATQNAFSLTGGASVSGRFEWQGRRLVYRLENAASPGNAYVMRVASGAKSKDGVSMNVDYIVHFVVGSTVQSPVVVSTVPASSAQGVSENADITFVFSRPMDKTSVQSAFSLSPSAAGTFTWAADATSFTYHPSPTPLSAGTVYTASISTAAKDSGGIAMSAGHSVSFQVGSDLVRPSILSVTESGTVRPMADIQAGVFKESSFVISFSEPMDGVATKNSVALVKLDDAATVSTQLTWNSTFARLTVDPVETLEPKATYRLTIATSAKDQSGNAILANKVLTFTVDNSAGAMNSEYLEVLSATKTAPTPSDGLSISSAGILNPVTLGSGSVIQVEIVFSRPLDLNTVGDNIFVTKRLGTCAQTPGLTAISFWDQAPYMNNVLRLDITGLSTCEYEIQLLGTKSEIRSAPVGAETGTWMAEDIKIYIKGKQT